MEFKAIAMILTATLIGFVVPSDIKMIDESAKCLFAHNALRQLHGAQSLEWDPVLAQDCLDFAKKLVEDNKLEHSSGPYGENLGLGWGGIPTCINSVYDWYNEYTKHDFSSNNFIFASGHFTQVVWNSTLKVGMAVARSAELDRWATCARYTPAGNMADAFLANVFPITNSSMLPTPAQMTQAAENVTDFASLDDTTFQPKDNGGHALGFWRSGKEMTMTILLLRSLPFVFGYLAILL